MQCGRRPSFFLAWGFFYSVFSFLEKSHFLLYPLLVGIFCWAIFMPFWAFSYPLSYGGLFPLSSLGPLKGHLQPSLRFSLFHCASRIWRKCKCLRSDTLTKVKLSEDWRGDQKELSISYLLIFLFRIFICRSRWTRNPILESENTYFCRCILWLLSELNSSNVSYLIKGCLLVKLYCKSNFVKTILLPEIKLDWIKFCLQHLNFKTILFLLSFLTELNWTLDIFHQNSFRCKCVKVFKRYQIDRKCVKVFNRYQMDRKYVKVFIRYKKHRRCIKVFKRYKKLRRCIKVFKRYQIDRKCKKVFKR